MKIKLVETVCTKQTSINCTKTFMRKIQRGRPQIACDACRNAPSKNATVKTVTVSIPRPTTGTCGCGNVFEMNTRGRKREKCSNCATAGIQYRTDSDGMVAAIRAETIAEEQREIREEQGRLRAKNLTEMMNALPSMKAYRAKLAAETVGV